MGIHFCGCTNNVSSSLETNIVIKHFIKFFSFKQYSNNKDASNNFQNNYNDGNKIQYYNNNFTKNWSLDKFNSLPLIQRITMINQANRIIQAFRNYTKAKAVRIINIIKN